MLKENIMRLPAIGLLWLLMVFSLGISEAGADSLPKKWTVSEATGEVSIKTISGLALSTQTGTKLDPPFAILTGTDGRVVVTHGQDKLTISPNSKSVVPEPGETGQITRIQQTLGSVLYHVQHRVKARFEVDTPYLVSVVKGTTFNIHVSSDASTVALIEGRLQVYTPDKKFELIMKPGQVATKSQQSKGIMLNDQRTLSSLKQGPITVLKESDSPLAAETVISAHPILGVEKAPGDGLNTAAAAADGVKGNGVSNLDGKLKEDGSRGGKGRNADRGSKDSLINGGSAFNAGADVPFPTMVLKEVGSSLTSITHKSPSSTKKDHSKAPKPAKP